MTKTLLTSLVLCSALFAQTPASKSASSKAATSKGAASKSATSKGGTPAARASLMNPASLRAKAPEMYKAEFTTTKGVVVVEVHRDWAPLGADRFYNLIKAGFFTNAAFFRVVPGFVVQFGLNANPAVNAVWENARIKDDPVKNGNKRGTIVFATAGPNTRTTQLFINFSDNTPLDAMGFAAFGEVVQGMDVVDMIYSGYGQRPDQGRITAEGDAYISKNFPMIDKIKMAKILPAAPAAAADKK
jgi:peptidyl-prolyl cis-trans isomerase A (cyclophilin A)